MNLTELGRAMFVPADKLDVEGWSSCLTADVTFRFGNAEILRGREAVRAAIGPFFDSIAGLQHEVDQEWSVGDTVIQQLTVTYTRHDASTLTIPAVNILRFRGDEIAEYLIYADTSALYA